MQPVPGRAKGKISLAHSRQADDAQLSWRGSSQNCWRGAGARPRARQQFRSTPTGWLGLPGPGGRLGHPANNDMRLWVTAHWPTPRTALWIRA
jgi:hypothetical protein